MGFSFNFYILLVTATAAVTVARAADQPAWVNATPPADAHFYYYVGTSNDSATLEEAKKEAYKNAVGDAIRDRFGVTTQIENDQYLTDTSSHAITRVRESSQSVNIKGFEKVDTFVEQKNKIFHVASLFRYPKSEAALEKSRLVLAPTAEPDVPTEIQGSSYSTELNLTTEPSGATVWVNDLPLGHSPLNLKGLLPPGPMHVRFDQPYFEIETRELVLVSGESTQVHALLRPSKAQLRIEGAPPRSDILINHQAQVASLRQFDLIAGQSYRLEIRNADYHPLVVENLVLDRGELRKISAQLIPKPSRLKIASIPSAAFVRINGENAGRTPFSGTLAPGKYFIEIGAKGFAKATLAVTLDANQKIDRVVTLSRPDVIDAPERAKESDTRQSIPEKTADDRTLLNLGFEFAGAQFKRIDAPMARVTFAARTVGRNWLGYGGVFSIGIGEGKAAQYDATVTEVFGARFNLNHEFQIFGLPIEVGVEPGYHMGAITLKSHADAVDVTHKDWHQTSLGEYIGLNIYPQNGGMMQLQLGARTYSDYESLQSGNTLFFSFSWGGFL